MKTIYKDIKHVLKETRMSEYWKDFAKDLPHLTNETQAKDHLHKHLHHVARFYRKKGWMHDDAIKIMSGILKKAATDAFITKK